MGSWVKVNVKPPVERSGGGSISTTINAAGFKAVAGARSLANDIAHATVNAAVDRWPLGPERRRRNGVHSRNTFKVIDASRGFFVSVSITNSAPWSAFVYYPGLGKGPWPGPGKGIRLREDYVDTPLETTQAAIKDELRRRVIAALMGAT